MRWLPAFGGSMWMVRSMGDLLWQGWCSPSRVPSQHDAQDIAVGFARVGDFVGERADQVYAEAADGPVLDVGLQIGRRLRQRIERFAVITEAQGDAIVVDGDLQRDLV